MLIRTNTPQAVTTAEAVLMAQMNKLYTSPVLVAKLKDFTYKLSMMVLGNLPTTQARDYDVDIDQLTMLHFYMSQIEEKQQLWATQRRTPKYYSNVTEAIATQLASMNIGGYADAEFLNMERAINKLIVAGNAYAPEERTKDFWVDHRETMEFLHAWLFDLQDYYELKFEDD